MSAFSAANRELFTADLSGPDGEAPERQRFFAAAVSDPPEPTVESGRSAVRQKRQPSARIPQPHGGHHGSGCHMSKLIYMEESHLSSSPDHFFGSCRMNSFGQAA